MGNLSQSILILFGVSAAFAFIFPLVRDGVLKQLSGQGLVKSIIPFVIAMLPFAAVFGFASYLQINVAVTGSAFAGAALLTFLLARIGLPPALRGILLLAAGVALTSFLPGDNQVAGTAAASLGLLAAKLLDNLLFAAESTYEDAVIPLSWLGGDLYLQMQTGGDANLHENMLLGIISVCLLLRVFQRPFMTDDRWLVKRLVLSATGGLAALLVMTKLLLQTEVWNLALLVGAAIFCSYLFQNVDLEGENKVSASTGIQQLLVIGVLTLVAARFFGTYGYVMLIPAAIVPFRGGIAQYLGMFFLSRVLVQGFVSTYNDNVTGINLTHPYAGAAQYAGFIVVAILFVLLRELTDRRARAALFLLCGALIPMGAEFYLHAEPTSSLLVAATVAGVILAALGPGLTRSDVPFGFGNLLLATSMMSVAGITYGGLIEAGVNANNETRLGILGGFIALSVVGAAVAWFISRRGNAAKKPLAATTD
jgi:hypothetical protein